MGIFDLFKKKNKICCGFFCSNHKFKYLELPLDESDNNSSFTFGKGRYVVDRKASKFFTLDKKAIYFYIEGIPNPIIFDFNKYLKLYIENKRNAAIAAKAGKEIPSDTFDEMGNLVDISFSSTALEYYKRDDFIKKLLSRMTPEQFKIIIALIGVLGLAFIAIILIVLFKK